MKRKRKIILVSSLSALAALVAILIIVRLSLESVVEKGVETIGSQVLGVKVEIGSVGLSLMGGELTIKDFKVGNPKGYNAPCALDVGYVHVDIVPTSLLSGKIRVEEIAVDGVNTSYEQGLTSSNISEIKSSIDSYTKLIPKGGESKAKESSGGKRLQVDKVSIKNVNVAFSAKGLNAPVKIPVPDIEMRDLGKDEDGIGAGELAVEIMNGLLGGIFKAVKSGVSGVSDLVGDGAGSVVDGVKSGGEKIVDGVIGIFK